MWVIEISKSILGEKSKLLKENMEVSVQFYEEKALSVDLPNTVELIIERTDAAIKGQTASSSYKPAILKNGLRVMVPPHIEVGVKILVSTLDCTYAGKHKL